MTCNVTCKALILNLSSQFNGNKLQKCLSLYFFSHFHTHLHTLQFTLEEIGGDGNPGVRMRKGETGNPGRRGRKPSTSHHGEIRKPRSARKEAKSSPVYRVRPPTGALAWSPWCAAVKGSGSWAGVVWSPGGVVLPHQWVFVFIVGDADTDWKHGSGGLELVWRTRKCEHGFCNWSAKSNKSNTSSLPFSLAHF